MIGEGLAGSCYRTEGLIEDSGLSYGAVGQQRWLWGSSFILGIQR